MPGLSSGVKLSSFATEWVSTDGWLRAALTVRSTDCSARSRPFRRHSRWAPVSRCQIGAWLQTRMPARSKRSSSRSLIR